MATSNTKTDYDIISRLNGLGRLSQAQTNVFYGLNHRMTSSPLPVNCDIDGLTFFTRPRLNLSDGNLYMDRMFRPLLTDDVNTVQRYIRTMLDPVGSIMNHITCPVVDPLNPFIPLLSNNLLSLSGWPDIQADTYTTEPGVIKEEFSMIDSSTRNVGSYTLSASFRNLPGDPITAMMALWVRYASLIYEGIMVPYTDAIVERRIDYNTRIYRLVLDSSKQFVQKIGACGVAFPTASTLGAAFNFSSDSPYSNENTQISIPFQALGANYLDFKLVEEFNKLVCTFNKGMSDTYRNAQYRKLVTNAEKDFFNFKAYPRIDYSMELEWYVSNDTYKEYTNGVKYVSNLGKKST